jgi:phage-related protein
MSKPLSIATVIEANRLSSDVPFLALIDLEVVNPVTGVVITVKHIANNGDPVLFNGNTYEAGKFDITVNTEAGKQADVSLSVNDYTQTIQGYMEQYGGGIGSNVTLYIVNANELDLEPEAMEFFQIVGATSQGYTQQFKLGAENTLMLTFPRRTQRRDFCSHQYKDPLTCRYSGPLSACDLTLKGANGCAAHNNTLNFGALPGLNSNGYRYS